MNLSGYASNQKKSEKDLNVTSGQPSKFGEAGNQLLNSMAAYILSTQAVAPYTQIPYYRFKYLLVS